MVFNKKKLIKIPNPVSVFYLKKKNIIIFKFFSKLKFISLTNFYVNIICFKNKLYLITTQINNDKSSTLIVYVNLFLTDIQNKLYKKLTLIGIGYKVVKINFNENKQVLLFKFGLSHSVYFKVTLKEVFLFCLKFTKIFVTSNCSYSANFVSGQIKSLKVPDIYKGKGLRYQNEAITLKIGKKA